MKVYIGPYRDWFGPYQLAELLCFWAKKEKDEIGIEREPEWVHNFGHWLATGSWDGEKTDPFDRKKEHKTLLHKFLIWIDKFKVRPVYIKIDKYDTWSMDSTLAPIILPMLKQLRATKHGSGVVDMEDVPKHLRCTTTEEWDEQKCFDFYREDETEMGDRDVHARWDWVLDEMIWAFEQLCDDDNDAQFHSGVHDKISVPCEWDENGKATMYRMEKGPNDTSHFDSEGYQKHNERINNGTRLFGKYFRNLWD